MTSWPRRILGPMSAGLVVRVPVERVSARAVDCPRCQQPAYAPCRKVYGWTADGLAEPGDIQHVRPDAWRLVLGWAMQSHHAERRLRARELRATGGVRR